MGCAPDENEMQNNDGLVRLAAGTAALLVFFSGAAWTGVVASDLSCAAYHLLYRLQIAGTRHAGLIQFTAFPALEGFFDFIDGGGHLPLWLVPVTIPTHTRNGYGSLWRYTAIP